MSNRYFLAPTSQFYFCGIPFRLDTSTKCSLGCQYCFSTMRKGNRSSENHYNDCAIIEKQICEPGDLGVVNEWIKQKMPIHFGGMSDPFSTPRSVLITSKLIKILNQAKYPVVISTKKPNEILKLLCLNDNIASSNIIIQVSFSVFDSRLAMILEPNAPLPSERIEAINLLTKMGYKVVARIQPYIPQYSGDVINDLLPRLFSARVEHIVLEHLKIPVERSSRELLSHTFDQLNFSIDKYFKYGYIKNGRDFELPQAVKLDKIYEIKSKCLENGVTFGAGDYGFYHMSTTSCCCGIDKFGYNNWFKGNYSNIIKTCKDYISVNELEKYEYPKSSIAMYVNSQSRLSNQVNTFKSLLIHKWNMPGTTNSIDSYFGIEVCNEKDSQGNSVYKRIKSL